MRCPGVDIDHLGAIGLAADDRAYRRDAIEPADVGSLDVKNSRSLSGRSPVWAWWRVATSTDWSSIPFARLTNDMCD